MKSIVVFGIVSIVASLSFVSYAENSTSSDVRKSIQPNNQIFDIQQYKGKVVYLDFWASWCIPCRKSFPWMNKIQEQYSPDEFVVVAVNLDKEKKLAVDFLKEYPANFQIIYDPKAKIAKKYQIEGMPSSILFNSKGKPVFAHKGFFSKKIPKYEVEIQNLLTPQSN